MISTRTVFVVGAGASVPYGLPTGSGLLDAAKNIDPSSATGMVLVEGPPDWQTRKANLQHFLAIARQYDGPSIDALLEDRPPLRQMGHEIIAALMGPWADEARKSRAQEKVSEEDDWILYLARKMRTDARTWERFCENPVSFVTFNFDTVIEEELAKALQGFYGQAADVNRLPKVIHVHGRLPTFSGLTQRWVMEAARVIKVVHDELDQSAVAAAQAQIQAADVVCFLGMSYQKPNMDTLDSIEFRNSTKVREYFGTTCGLSVNEIRHASRWFPPAPISTVFGPEKCRDFLAQHHVLRW